MSKLNKRKTSKNNKSFSRRKKIVLGLVSALILLPIIQAIFHTFKPLPAGISVAGERHETSSLQFLYDLTYANKEGEVEHEQEIFDYIYQMIDEAEDFIVIDMFLFNDDYDHTNPDLDFPSLSSELADALIHKKTTQPDMPIIFITDPINTFYGTYTTDPLAQMRDAGIDVILTDLSPLRDSNPVYSGPARTFLSWLGTSDASYLPNIFRATGPGVNVNSFAHLLHFKANHRKVVMNEREGLVTSANPHDASAFHSNIAYAIQGPLLNDLLASEKAVAEMSGYDTAIFDSFEIKSDVAESDDTYTVQLLTEGKIKEALLSTITEAKYEDYIKIGMFYLSDRDVINALTDADSRGVSVQLVLDINQDAFGNEKIGIPNRPVAHELTEGDSNIAVRWYESNGEQFHAKFFIHETAETVTTIGGSTNFTRRNMDDLNLETNVLISGQKGQHEIDAMLTFFDRIWENQDGTYTADYTEHAESTSWKNMLYRFQEWSGLSTF